MLEAVALLFLKILEQWLKDSRGQEAPKEEVHLKQICVCSRERRSVEGF